MFGRFVNGIFERAPYRISKEEAEILGFKPVVLTPAPETDEYHVPVEWLEETSNEIIRHWNVVPFQPEPDDPTADEILSVLLGGAAV